MCGRPKRQPDVRCAKAVRRHFSPSDERWTRGLFVLTSGSRTGDEGQHGCTDVRSRGPAGKQKRHRWEWNCGGKAFECAREAESYLGKGAYSNILTPLLPLRVGSLIGVNALHLGSGEALPGFVGERQLSKRFTIFSDSENTFEVLQSFYSPF